MKKKEIPFNEFEEAFKKHFENSVKDLTCPVHGQQPTIHWKNHDGASELNLTYCCSVLEALAKDRMDGSA